MIKKILVFGAGYVGSSLSILLAEHFKSSCDLILANRMDDALLSVADKVFTRDLYGEN